MYGERCTGCHEPVTSPNSRAYQAVHKLIDGHLPLMRFTLPARETGIRNFDPRLFLACSPEGTDTTANTAVTPALPSVME